jgi:hypothetical protein
LLLAVSGVHAQYKWTDAKGHVSYGDQPPRDARKVERIEANTGIADRGLDALAALPFEVRRAAKDFPVVLYVASGTQCLPCTSARTFLKAHAVPFAERTIATDKDLVAFQGLGGGTQLPALTVGRDWLRGFEPGAWTEAIRIAGYPQGIELPPAWQWPAATPLTPPDAAPPPVTTPVATPGNDNPSESANQNPGQAPGQNN